MLINIVSFILDKIYMFPSALIRAREQSAGADALKRHGSAGR